MSKFCSYCGAEVNDNAVVCIKCGCAVSVPQSSPKENLAQHTEQGTEMKTQTSLVLGIIGIVFAWIFALVGHIASIIGIVIGIKEYKETNKMTGLTLSIIGEICAIFSSILGAVSMAGYY